MTLDDMFHRWLDRIGGKIVHQGDLPETVRADRVLDDAFDTLPSTDERRLPAQPDPELEPEYAAAIEAAGGAIDLAQIREDQHELMTSLVAIGRPSAGPHQIHRNPDVPCDCCAALDFAVAGLIDDADDFGEGAGR